MTANLNSMNNECPLCGSVGTVTWKRAKAKDVSYAYMKSLGVNIDEDIKGVSEFLLLRCGTCDLGYFMPPCSGGPGFYEQLQELEFYYPGGKEEFHFASRCVGASTDVLEIGCGAGHFADVIKPRSYVGLEFTQRAVQMARARGLSVERRSIEEYAKEHPESVDVVCAFQVLEHIPAPKMFLKAAVRALRPGGRMIISVPSADSFVSEAVNNVLNMPPHHLTWWTDKALQELGNRLSLEVETIEHEVLTDDHLEFYLYTLCMRGIKRRGITDNLLISSKTFGLSYRLISLIVPLLARGLNDRKLRPKGHSVNVVYRKV